MIVKQQQVWLAILISAGGIGLAGCDAPAKPTMPPATDPATPASTHTPESLPVDPTPTLPIPDSVPESAPSAAEVKPIPDTP